MRQTLMDKVELKKYRGTLNQIVRMVLRHSLPGKRVRQGGGILQGYWIVAAVGVILLCQLLFAENNFANEPDTCLIYKSVEGEKQPVRYGDRLWAVDKYQHFVASALVFALVYDMLQVEGRWNQTKAIQAGISVSFGLGVAKELWDRNRPGHVASWKDLLADAVGVTFGLLCFAVATR